MSSTHSSATVAHSLHSASFQPSSSPLSTMALLISLKFPAVLVPPSLKPSKTTLISIPAQSKPAPTHSQLRLIPNIIRTRRTKTELFTVRSVGETQENEKSEASGKQEASSGDDSNQQSSPAQVNAKLGEEIKEAMKQRKEEREGDLWSGVAEEIKEIEWPVFGKVLGTTGVVLSIIAGSSVVLLTVNAILAELSDKIFAGRGVQDFFG